ncbi:MAG: leucine-rich repeat domain-containing protein, partial [Holosporales bacterium]|nr:leucine-rich repeat domain-containing protein [Holosporales bacterium]
YFLFLFPEPYIQFLLISSFVSPGGGGPPPATYSSSIHTTTQRYNIIRSKLDIQDSKHPDGLFTEEQEDELLIDDLKLLKGTGETIVPSSGYYYSDGVLSVFKITDFNSILEQCLAEEDIYTTDTDELRIYCSPSLSIMSLPITNWGHLEEITIDEFSLTPGTYDSSSDTYDPPIWKTLLADIRAIGIATTSQLHTIRLDSLVSAGGSNLLASCSALTSVDFPSLVSCTGNYLLAGCSALTSVNFPSLTSVGDGLLAGCFALTSVDLSSLVSYTGNYLLAGCIKLTSVDLSSLANYTGGNLLANCSALTTVDLSSLANYTGGGLLASCSALTTVDLSSLVSYTGNALLASCIKLTSVDFPSLTSVGDGLLAGCSSLIRVYFGSTITSWEAGNMFVDTITTNITLYLCDAEYNRDNADTDVANKTWRNITFGSIIKGAPPA